MLLKSDNATSSEKVMLRRPQQALFIEKMLVVKPLINELAVDAATNRPYKMCWPTYRSPPYAPRLSSGGLAGAQ